MPISVAFHALGLIWLDKMGSDDETFQRLKAELNRAFATPDNSYEVLDSDTVIRRNASRTG